MVVAVQRRGNGYGDVKGRYVSLRGTRKEAGAEADAGQGPRGPCPNLSCPHRHWSSNSPPPPSPSLHSSCDCIIMVRSTIIVRASDALPLAASVDDEQVRMARGLTRCPFPRAGKGNHRLTGGQRVTWDFGFLDRQNKHCKSTSSRRSSSLGG
jgi:hypothetical protein